MGDKTMLELAARACGIALDKSFSNGGPGKNDGFDCNGNAVLDWHNGYVWNPLTHDGDALRLAVKLRLECMYAPGDDGACTCQYWIGGEGFKQVTEEINGDPYAATRRAIVRAAAEIGKATGRGDGNA